MVTTSYFAFFTFAIHAGETESGTFAMAFICEVCFRQTAKKFSLLVVTIAIGTFDHRTPDIQLPVSHLSLPLLEKVARFGQLRFLLFQFRLCSGNRVNPLSASVSLRFFRLLCGDLPVPCACGMFWKPFQLVSLSYLRPDTDNATRTACWLWNALSRILPVLIIQIRIHIRSFHHVFPVPSGQRVLLRFTSGVSCARPSAHPRAPPMAVVAWLRFACYSCRPGRARKHAYHAYGRAHETPLGRTLALPEAMQCARGVPLDPPDALRPPPLPCKTHRVFHW